MAADPKPRGDKKFLEYLRTAPAACDAVSGKTALVTGTLYRADDADKFVLVTADGQTAEAPVDAVQRFKVIDQTGLNAVVQLEVATAKFGGALTVKELTKDPIFDPRNELPKDPVFDTRKEPIWDPPGTLWNDPPQQAMLPFIMATPHHASAAALAAQPGPRISTSVLFPIPYSRFPIPLSPMILIISEPNDVHAQAVMRELARQRNVDTHLLDLSDFPLKMSVVMRERNGARSSFGLRLGNGTVVDMDDVGAVWWRRPQPFGLPQRGMAPEARHFAMVESATAFQGMWQVSDALWVNNIVRDAAAAHKPWQLDLAREIGLTIPDTLMTNDPDQARAFWAKYPNEVIYKPFLQSFHSWRETRILRKEEEALAASIRFAPVIFQKYIPAEADLRITVIGDDIFAAEADTEKSDYKVDVRLNNVPYLPHRLPVTLEAKLLRLMRLLGLEYGAIDMRLTPEGEYVFLEVNPAGQFLYVEYSAKLPIAAALAAHLVRGKQTPGEGERVLAIA
ncbi:MAG: MvdC/MvdD family ATP grasp protein [Gemmatimonadota bacterium]